MKKISILSILLFICATICAGEIKLISPLNCTVPLLSEAQKQFFDMPMAERRLKYTDPTTRTQWTKTGSLPLAVEFVWQSDLAHCCEFTLLISADGVEKSYPVSGGKLQLTNLIPGSEYSWKISAKNCGGETFESAIGKFTTESGYPRLIAFGELGNVRDLGGYNGIDGRKVKYEKIYRGRAFNDVSPDRETTPGKMRVDDSIVAQVRPFGIKSDLELRSDGETAGMTSSSLGTDIKWCRTHGMDSYEKILKAPQQKRLASIIRFLLNEDDYPFYIHCDGGRDRTGAISFLVLGALGVSNEDIERDWQASALFFSDLQQQSFDKLIAALREKYGEVSYSDLAKAYLREIGITDIEIEKLREIMLDK